MSDQSDRTVHIALDLDQEQKANLETLAREAGFDSIGTYLAAEFLRLAGETRLRVTAVPGLSVRYARYEGNALVIYQDEAATEELRRYDRSLLKVMQGDPDPAYGAALMERRWYRIIWLEAA